MKEQLKSKLFWAKLLLFVLAIVSSGGMALAEVIIGDNGSDTDPNDSKPLENATPDDTGKGIDQQGQGLTGSAVTDAELAENSLRLCCRYLGITTPIMRSSQLDVPATLSREKRLIEICRRYHADRYINASGGQELYSQNMFSPYNIQLEFIHPLLKPYRVRGRNFMPGLSVLDAIMCCGSAFVAESLLDGYAIVEAV